MCLFATSAQIWCPYVIIKVSSLSESDKAFYSSTFLCPHQSGGGGGHSMEVQEIVSARSVPIRQLQIVPYGIYRGFRDASFVYSL